MSIILNSYYHLQSMVHVNSLKCVGLYSFSNEIDFEFSDRMLIVGPNNSGKSNILKILRLLIDTFYQRHQLGSSEISHTSYESSLEIDITLSPPESKKIVDFLSFHPDQQNSNSLFFEYRNYELLQKLFDAVHIKLSWKREVGDNDSEPYIKIEFTKLGLKLFNLNHSDFKVSSEFPKDGENYTFNQSVKLHTILDTLSEKDEIKEKISKVFGSVVKEHIGIDRLRVNRNMKMSDKTKQILRELYSYMNLSLETSSDIAFTELFGTILKKGIRYSSDSRRMNGLTLLDYADMLKLDTSVGGGQDATEKLNFNTVLDSQAFSKSMEFTTELQSDGNNLASFLFSLKNSQSYEDRTKFDNIQKIFEDIFKSDNLSFDVILQYDIKRQYRVWGGKDTSKPKLPSLVVFDRNLKRQFPLDRVGAGLSEIIYLLTMVHGVETSLILLDEPSVNLHPPLMKSLMRHLQNSKTKNQFVIITHSPELTSFELFENNAIAYYIRKTNQTSKVKMLEGETKKWFDNNRGRLRHQIDTRIFFSKGVILTEGDSDQNFLAGISEYFTSINSELDIVANDVIITNVGGKENFAKYRSLLDSFGIPYLILADADAKNLFESPGTITKDKLIGKNSVYVIENGNLEDLMMAISPDVYSKATRNNGNSKPAIAYEFTKNVSTINLEHLKSLQSLLLHAVNLATN